MREREREREINKCVSDKILSFVESQLIETRLTNPIFIFMSI